MRQPALTALTALSLLILVAAVGCQPPKGQSSGRIGVTTTTESETETEQLLPVTLIEFSDQFPQRLLQDLREEPDLQAIDGQATIVLGDINNKTSLVSSTEFEILMRRIRNNLLRSDIARGQFNFVADRSRLRRLAQRERVATDDGRVADAGAYDPQNTYVLLGDFYRIRRGGDEDTNYYYMEVQLVSFATNEIVFSDVYESKQVEQD
ncbi:MAG: hypothetical protein ACLFV3_09485 [Phycisphaeraceae bacterium]